MMPSALFLALLLVVAGCPIPARGQPPAGVELRGQIDSMTDSELLVRGEDGRLHRVDTAAMPSADLGLLTPGDVVVITTRGEGPRGPIGRTVRRQPAPPLPR